MKLPGNSPGHTASPFQTRLRFDSTTREPSPPALVLFTCDKCPPPGCEEVAAITAATTPDPRESVSGAPCSSQTVTCKDSGKWGSAMALLSVGFERPSQTPQTTSKQMSVEFGSVYVGPLCVKRRSLGCRPGRIICGETLRTDRPSE